MARRSAVNIPQVVPFPEVMQDLVAAGGADLSQARLSANRNPASAYNLENVEPSLDGYGNFIEDKGIGTNGRLNTNRLTTSKIQGMFGYGNNLCYVRSGNLYTIPLNGGAESLQASNKFSTNKRVRAVRAVGGTPRKKKVYLFDGTVDYQAWDGTTLAAITSYQTAYGQSWGKPLFASVWRGKLFMGFNESDPNNSVLLGSDLRNAESFTSGQGLEKGFSVEVGPEDGEPITGLGVLKRNNSPDDQTALIAAKKSACYQAGQVIAPDTGQPYTIFDLLQNRFGCVNADCITDFNNNLQIFSKSGWGGFTSAVQSGGIDAKTYEFGLKVNNKILECAKSPGFENSICLHIPDRQQIIALTTRNLYSSAQQNGFDYGEIPLDYAIVHRYGVFSKSGKAISQWSFRGGPGWAWSAMCEYQGRIFVGSYLGDVYELYTGYEYERLDASPGVKSSIPQLYYSEYLSGDITYPNGLNGYKSIQELVSMWKTSQSFQVDYDIFYQNTPFEERQSYLNNMVEGAANLNPAAVYGSSNYGQSGYAGIFPAENILTPCGAGSSFRVRVRWPSLVQKSDGTYVTNIAALTGIKGNIEIGGRYR